MGFSLKSLLPKKGDKKTASVKSEKSGKPLRDPKGLVRFGDNLASAPLKEGQFLAAWATRTWGEGKFDTLKAQDGKSWLVMLKPRDSPVSVKTDEELDRDDVIAGVQSAIKHRPHLDALAEKLRKSGGSSPSDWWAALFDEVEDLELGMDGPSVLIGAVLMVLGQSTKGNKRLDLTTKFVLSVPEVHRELALRMAQGAYVGFYGSKTPKESVPTSLPNPSENAPPPEADPAVPADSGEAGSKPGSDDIELAE